MSENNQLTLRERALKLKIDGDKLKKLSNFNPKKAEGFETLLGDVFALMRDFAKDIEDLKNA